MVEEDGKGLCTCSFSGLHKCGSAMKGLFSTLISPWTNLTPETKAKVFLVVSTVIGTCDTVLDWVVIMNWYLVDKYWRLATCLLVSIVVSGICFALFALFNWGKGYVYESTDYLLSKRRILFVPFVLGYGNIILAIMILQDPSIFLELYFQFQLGRSLEIFVESAPGGGLQLFYLIVEDKLSTSSSEEMRLFLSIILSICSIAFGTEESCGKFLDLHDRVLLLIFSASDFIFRIASMSFFIKHYSDFQFYVLPAIFSFECIPWILAFKNFGAEKKGLKNIRRYLSVVENIILVFAGAMTSICTSGIFLTYAELTHLRRNFFIYFMIRFIISFTLCGFVYANHYSDLFIYITIPFGALSFLISFRILFLLQQESDVFYLNRDMLLKKPDINYLVVKAIEKENMAVVDRFKDRVDMDSALKAAFSLEDLTNLDPVWLKLIQLGANVNTRNPKKSLRYIVPQDQELKKGPKFKSNFIYGGPAYLHLASRYGRDQVVRALVDLKADINLPADDGKAGLHIASENGHEQVVRALVDLKADINLCDNYGKTCLHYASEKGHEEVVRALVDLKADINLSQNTGKTCLHYASETGHEEVVRALVDLKADINLSQITGRTCLHTASENGHEQVVRALVDLKADINLCDNYGKTCFHYANFGGHEQIVKVLHKLRADINLQSSHQSNDHDSLSPTFSMVPLQIASSDSRNGSILPEDFHSQLHQSHGSGSTFL